MGGVGPEILDAALVAVRELVKAGASVKRTTQAFSHAEFSISAALASSDSRRELLMRLARSRAEGEIPEAAYRTLMATVARLLKSEANLVTECERIVRGAKTP